MKMSVPIFAAVIVAVVVFMGVREAQYQWQRAELFEKYQPATGSLYGITRVYTPTGDYELWPPTWHGHLKVMFGIGHHEAHMYMPAGWPNRHLHETTPAGEHTLETTSTPHNHAFIEKD